MIGSVFLLLRNSLRFTELFKPQRVTTFPLHQKRKEMIMHKRKRSCLGFVLLGALIGLSVARATWAAGKPNIVMLMTDDTGWNDFGAYSLGGAGLGHPTPNVDRIAKEGLVFTNWYGQASCTAGRASFITGRIPIRSALSIVVAPGDENRLRKQTPTIAEFSKSMGTPRISRANGIWATRLMRIRPNMASRR
jgi:Sulfatase